MMRVRTRRCDNSSLYHAMHAATYGTGIAEDSGKVLESGYCKLVFLEEGCLLPQRVIEEALDQCGPRLVRTRVDQHVRLVVIINAALIHDALPRLRFGKLVPQH